MKRSFNSFLSAAFFCVLILVSCINGFEIDVISYVGKGIIGIILLLSFLINIHSLSKSETFKIKYQDFWLYLPLIAWFLIYSISLFISSTSKDFYVVAQLFFLIFFLITVVKNGSLFFPNKFLLMILITIVLINLGVVALRAGGRIWIPFRDAGLFEHRNVLAVVTFYFMSLYILYFKKREKPINKVWILPFILLIYLVNSRAVYGALIIFLGTYFFWNYLTKYKFIFYTALFSSMILNLIFIGVMAGWFVHLIPEMKILNVFFVQYTGGNLASGREDIWPHIISEIGKRPFIGHGPAYQPSSFLNTSLSSHNYYLQIVLQSGLIGLFCFLWFLTNVWGLFRKYRDDNVVKVVAASILAILFQQIFEVSLTQNHMEQSILFWFITGLGLSQVNQINKQTIL